MTITILQLHSMIFFLNHQFITWDIKAVYGNYLVVIVH